MFIHLRTLTDGGIVMLTTLSLFTIPVNWRKHEFVMNWQTAQKLPWGILILFGGGLSLAAAVRSNGVAEFLGSLSRYIDNLPPLLLILIVTAAIVYLTELTSNLATVATLLPVLAALAPGLSIHPYLLIFPAAMAASCAFMLPVATPPNAIVFGSGCVTISANDAGGLMAESSQHPAGHGICNIRRTTAVFVMPQHPIFLGSNRAVRHGPSHPFPQGWRNLNHGSQRRRGPTSWICVSCRRIK